MGIFNTKHPNINNNGLFKKVIGFWFGENKPVVNQPEIINSSHKRNDYTEEPFIATTAQTSTITLSGLAVNADERALIQKYREMSLHPEVDQAINEITNEAISFSNNEYPIGLSIKETDLIDSSVRKKILEEFETIMNLYSFKSKVYDYFRRWYIDGRIYFHLLIDPKAPEEGIKEIRFLDALSVKKVREIDAVPTPEDPSISQIKTISQYYLYQNMYDPRYYSGAVQGMAASGQGVGYSVRLGGLGYGAPIDVINSKDPFLWTNNNLGIKLSIDSVVTSNSGLYNQDHSMILSYLHKAIKPLNQLRMMEDLVVIYRLARAPERLAFYIDVGEVSPQKGEEILQRIAQQHKNKITYNTSTGQVDSERFVPSVVENYYFARMGGRSTEVSTIAGGQNLGEIEDVQFMLDRLLRSLNVPKNRLTGESANFSLGKSNETTREEVSFHKFILLLRNQFVNFILGTLRVQLILKGVIKPDDWSLIRENVSFDFVHENRFDELIAAEIWTERFNAASSALAMNEAGFISKKWIMENMLKLSPEEWEKMQKQIEEEKAKESSEEEE